MDERTSKMSFLKKPFRKLRDVSQSHLSNDSVASKTDSAASSTSGTGTGTGTATPTNGVTNGIGQLDGVDVDSRRQSREVIAAQRERRSVDKQRAKAETKKRLSMARIEDEKFLQEAPPDMTKLYRPYSMNMSKRWNHENRLLFKEIDWESRSIPDLGGAFGFG